MACQKDGTWGWSVVTERGSFGLNEEKQLVGDDASSGALTYYADDERRKREEIIIGRDTSDLIISIANAFDNEQSYDEAINRVLAMIGSVIHPDRLLIFEWCGSGMKSTYEWCADGVASTIDSLQSFDDKTTAVWQNLLSSNTTIVIPDVDELAAVDPSLPGYFKSRGIFRMAAFPMISKSKLVGFFTVDNYAVDTGLDTRRLLETIALFVGARMVDQRLVCELEQSSTHDGLTGVLNRRGIDLAVEERLAENPGAPFVLGLIDLDDFKLMNDTYGHDVGDEALRFLAETITSQFSGDTIMGRNGGDEFLVMLFGDEVARADSLFEELSNTNMTFECNGKQYSMSMSIGYVEYPAQVDNLKSAYAKADAALYSVKLFGKSGFKRYCPEIETEYRSLLGFSSRDLAEFIPGGVMAHRATGSREILFANEEMVSLLECDSLADFMQFTGGTFDGLALPEDLPHVKEALERHLASGEINPKGFTEYRVRTKSGDVRHVLADSRLANDQEIGQVFYVLLIPMD